MEYFIDQFKTCFLEVVNVGGSDELVVTIISWFPLPLFAVLVMVQVSAMYVSVDFHAGYI